MDEDDGAIMIQIQVVSIPQFTQKMSRSIFPSKVYFKINHFKIYK